MESTPINYDAESVIKLQKDIQNKERKSLKRKKSHFRKKIERSYTMVDEEEQGLDVEGTPRDLVPLNN